jgi:hypothetical protein
VILEDAPDPDEVTPHVFLFRLAGRVPDGDLAVLRTHLADGEWPELAARLAQVVGAGEAALTEVEVGLVQAILAPDDELADDPTDRAPRLDSLADLPFWFSARRSESAPAGIENEVLPLALMDTADMVVAEAGGRVGGVIALWRAFRHSADGLATERVYLCETEPSANVVEMVAEMQHALAEAGEDPPRVEVFNEYAELTPYHENALGVAILVWAEEAPPVRLARVFDGADAGGPFFVPEHPRLEGPDRDQVLAFLRDGARVLDTPGAMDDIVETGRIGAVPLGFRSDGQWIWTEAVTYYLEHHQLAPEPELLRHALAGAPRVLNRLDHHRVLAALFAPAGEETVWQAG